MDAGELITVLIVSDSHIVRSGLRRILESQPNMAVLGEISTKSGNMDALLRQNPAIALVDLDPQGADALGFVRKVKRSSRNTIVLVLSDLDDEERARKALVLGATGVVLKMQPPSVLIATIESLCGYNGGPVELGRAVPKMRSDHRLEAPESRTAASTKIDSLTEREREVIGLIAGGLKNKAIARRLHISDITVRHHLTSIFNKLGVSDRQKLLILAHQQGLARLTLSSEVS